MFAFKSVITIEFALCSTALFSFTFSASDFLECVKSLITQTLRLLLFFDFMAFDSASIGKIVPSFLIPSSSKHFVCLLVKLFFIRWWYFLGKNKSIIFFPNISFRE